MKVRLYCHKPILLNGLISSGEQCPGSQVAGFLRFSAHCGHHGTQASLPKFNRNPAPVAAPSAKLELSSLVRVSSECKGTKWRVRYMQRRMRRCEFNRGPIDLLNTSAAPESRTENTTTSLLRTLLLCDLVDSTGLVERMGDLAGAELIRKHDRLARTLADRHGGREIDKTDGFMMMFDRPVRAVAFALDYQRGLKQLNAAEGANLSARVGIHVGDLVVWDNSAEDIARGAKPVEVEGLVKPVTSRLMNLALPGQILLSNIAYSLAHRAQGELGEYLQTARWRTHGRYRFRGVPDPVAVFEVGEEGLAPLKAPPWSSKAHREVPFWRRPATVVVEALVVIALITVPLFMFLRPDPAIAFASRDWVVVGSLHNLTGETAFDGALESALRISLEQSRYVNVLPDLKVRDTITRMQRDPDKTEIDRQVGSEVAIREGARALILPTIAEIGGRVRITAEVIDPQTQTTVYSETADGIGKESILPSLDTINERLRVRLGEALATVSNESKPLDKVATKDLDALKSYTLGTAKGSRGMFPEAIALFDQALRIDPEFASANLRLATIKVSMGKTANALEQFNKALAHRERLSVRDTLYAESFIATLEHQADWASKWQVLVDTYPDYFPATGAFAYMTWRDENRFDQSNIALALASASAKNPTPLAARHLLGILYLSNERYADANQVFSDAEADGLTYTFYHAATKAVLRQFDSASALLDKAPKRSPIDDPVVGSAHTLFQTAFLLDQGKITQAQETLTHATESLPESHPLRNQFATVALTIRAVYGDADDMQLGSAINSAISSARIESANAHESEHPDLAARRLVLAYLAARRGDLGSAKQTLSDPNLRTGLEHSIAHQLRLITEAEVATKSGTPKLAIQRLSSMLNGNEPYLAHIALLDAYIADSSDSAKSLREAGWLVTHRGRAYAEENASKSLMAINILESNLALLDMAEVAISLGDSKQATTAIAEFRKSWPMASQAPAYAMRVKKIEAELSGKAR